MMKVTPWINTREFEQTGEHLLIALNLCTQENSIPLGNNNNKNQFNSNDPSHLDLRHAINRVAIWRSRCSQGRLPHAAETSASIAEILFKDNLRSNNLYSSSTMELRLAYSAAIIRGVNGLADASHRNTVNNNNNNYEGLNSNKNNNPASSVATLCDRLGLPRWIVDMRHDASHSMLPSLPCLRMAARTLLGYLGERYWGSLSEKRKELKNEAWELLSKSCNSSLSDNDKNYDSSKKKPSPTKYAKEFVKSIPIDTGVDVALEYLVRGRADIPSSMPISNGITSDSTSHQGGFFSRIGALVYLNDDDTTENKTKTKQKLFSSNAEVVSEYLPFLKTLQNFCCGFLNALLVELVHTILFIESDHNYKAKQKIHQSSSTEDESTETTQLLNLFSWIQYLLSREFYSAFHNEKKSTKPISSSILYTPYTTLQKAFHFQLNSICDLCMDQIEEESKGDVPSITIDSDTDTDTDHRSNSITQKVADLLESILGSNRVEGNGLQHDLYPITKKRKRDLDIENAEMEMAKDDDISTNNIDNEKNNVVEKKALLLSSPAPSVQKVSLEEMEALLSSSDSDNDDDGKEEDPQTKEPSAEETICSPLRLNPMNDNTEYKKSSSNQSVWTLCKDWDPCPIGSLPGYTNTMLY